jgi:hypothetical protein
MSGYIFLLRLMTAVVLGSFAAVAALADDPLVYATIQPAQIALGESAQFTITNLGDGTNPIITLPVVSGLKFEIIGRTLARRFRRPFFREDRYPKAFT